jgi:hypothetical protein
MDFNAANRDGSLSLLLQQSLRDVLTAVSNEAAAPFNFPPVQHPSNYRPVSQRDPMASVMGLFPPTLSPGTSISLPASFPQPAMRSNLLFELTTQKLVLVAAAQAEKRYVEEQTAAATAAAAAAAAFRARSLDQCFKRDHSGSLLGFFRRSMVVLEVGFPQAPSPPATLIDLGACLRQKSSPYVDVANAIDPDPTDSRVKKTRGGVTEPFPERLHRLLKEIQNDGNGDVISFLPHGRAFAIHKPDRFVSEIMPTYFKMSQLSSFQRQLSL